MAVQKGSATRSLREVERALVELEARLAEVRELLAASAHREREPAAPHELQVLRMTLAAGLNIMGQGYRALGRWPECYEALQKLERMHGELRSGKHEIARTRLTQAAPLIEMGRIEEAKTLLEGCLDVFRQSNDLGSMAKALTELAAVWDDLGDGTQAIRLQREALAVKDQLPDPDSRAVSHNNLSLHLLKASQPDEARNHWLAGLTYRLVTGSNPQRSLNHLERHVDAAFDRGQRFALGRLARLLQMPGFSALRAFLAEREVSVPVLQARIDSIVEMAMREDQ